MEVVLTKVEWTDGDAYAVHVEVDRDDEKTRMPVGHVWRANGADAWRFNAHETFKPEDEHAAAFKADNIGQVREELSRRFRVVEVPRDRLSSDRMSETTAKTLLVLAALGNAANARGGYVHGVIEALGMFAVEHVNSGDHESFIQQVAEQLRTSIGKSAALQDAAQQFARMFADIARNHEETATDDPGVKH